MLLHVHSNGGKVQTRQNIVKLNLTMNPYYDYTKLSYIEMITKEPQPSVINIIKITARNKRHKIIVQ